MGLGVEMAQLAGRFGSIDPAAAGRAELEWSLRAGRRLRGMIDAREASVTFHLEARIRQGADDTEAELDDPPIAGNGDQSGAGEGEQPGAGDNDRSASDATGGDSPAAAGGSDEGGDGGANGDASANGSAGGEHRETAEEYAARLRRGKWLRRLPLFAAALEAGTITTAHVEALGAVLDHVEQPVVSDVLADEDALLEVARSVTRASFARYLRRRVDRIRDDGGAAALKRQIDESFGLLGYDDDLGLHRLFVRLDPIRGEQVYTAIRHRVEQLQQAGAADGRRRGQVIAQAITDLICGGAAATGGGVEMLVIVDLVTLLHGHHDASICETGDGLAIPIDKVRELCRQAATTITAAIRGPDGTTIAVGQHVQPAGASSEPSPPADDGGVPATGDLAAMVAAAVEAATGTKLQMGRDLRLANREQRRALRAMYRSCAHPGCRVPFADCFIHHVTPWEHDGLTDLANLLPLCGRHHHQVHDGGWRLTIDPARTLSWYQPGGTPDGEIPFQPLGATTPMRAGSRERRADDDATDDEDATESAATRPQAAPEATATINAWSRSRGARGSPPADHGDDELRLFDPTAA
jgi:hypothetical protein